MSMMKSKTYNVKIALDFLDHHGHLLIFSSTEVSSSASLTDG